MASHENTTPADDSATNAAQVEFSLNPRFYPTEFAHFWRAQERILDEVERFSSSWFRRRQEAAQSMIDAGRQIISEGGADPASVAKQIADWQLRSMERLSEDATDCTEMLSGCADALVSNEAEAMEETAETVKRATKQAKSEPV